MSDTSRYLNTTMSDSAWDLRKGRAFSLPKRGDEHE
jgi:hypothetical protein